MKRIIIRIFVSLLLALVLSGVFTVAATAVSMQNSFERDLYNNVIRLHIPARSDSEEDQKTKLEIRDAVLIYIETLTSEAKDIGEAYTVIDNNIQQIETFVCEKITDLGYSYPATVSLCTEFYPIRYYDGYTFPAGRYMSLKITLDNGKGKNWWCVLYPSVCTSLSSNDEEKLLRAGVSNTSSGYMCNDSASVRYSFYILEFVQKIKELL